VATSSQALQIEPAGMEFDAVASNMATIDTVANTVTIQDGGTAVYNIALPDALNDTDGYYSVTYNVTRDAVYEVNLTLTSQNTDPPPAPSTVDRMIKLPATAPLNGADIDLNQTARLVSMTTTSGARAYAIRVDTGGAGPVTIHQLRFLPLRTTSLVDPTTPSFGIEASSCASCHEDQFDQWRSSMMGYSSISPPIHALELTENHVMRPQGPEESGLIDPTMPFGRLARSANDAPSSINVPHAESGLFCQKCHAPTAVYTDVFRAFDDFGFSATNRGFFPDSHTMLRQLMGADPIDPNLAIRSGVNASDPLLVANATAGTEGIGCLICHSMNGRDESSTPLNLNIGDNKGPRPGFEPGVANSAFRVNHDPDGTTIGARMNLGPYDDYQVDTDGEHQSGKAGGDALVMEGTDGVKRPFIQTGQLCGTCHDVRIPFPDEGPDGVYTSSSGAGLTGDDTAFRRVENLFSEWRDGPWHNDNVPFASQTAAGAFENPARLGDFGVKLETTCQDCHMSKFVTEDAAPPADYEQGAITTFTSTTRRRSNHRFIGVDRFLTHDMPTPGDTDTEDLALNDIALGRGAAGDPMSSLQGADPAPTRPVPKAEEFPTIGASNRDVREILLQKAIDFKIEHVGPAAMGQLPIRIAVENVGSGHNIPAGLSEEREVWIQLEVLDRHGDNVFTSGYLDLVEARDGHQPHEFNPRGALRYDESYCGQLTSGFGKVTAQKEPFCDLDQFRVELGPYLNIMSNSLQFGEDTVLRNYQNGFSLNGDKVFTQFIADHIDNSKSLKPFQKVTEQFNVPVGTTTGPFTVNARLRFRPFAYEFLEGLRNSVTDADCAAATAAGRNCYRPRIDDTTIERNVVIEMENDSCVADGYGLFNSRACSRENRAPLALGNGFTCAVFGANDYDVSTVDARGSLQCFGTNANGEVGIGVGPNAVSTPSVTHLLDVNMVSLGDAHGCALLNDGTVSCWGDGTGGKLADGVTSNHHRTAPRLSQSLSDVSALASGGTTTCALSVGGQPGDETVRCWGRGTSGELGDGVVSSHDRGTPYILPTTGSNALVGATSIAAGAHHYCAVARSGAGVPGAVKCWGQAKGIGQAASSAIPLELPSANRLKYRVQKLAAGDNFTCALAASHEIYCWGDNTYGTLGDGTTSDSLAPVKAQVPYVQPGDSTPIDITAGLHHVCALMSDGTIMCWGLGDNGRLGDGDMTSHLRTLPHTVGVLTGDVSFVAAGGAHTCAVRGSQRFCWGANSAGQLGLGTFVDAADPQEVTAFVNPNVNGRVYYAPSNQGGFGTADCTTQPPFTVACNEVTESGQTYIDLNDNTGYRFKIQTDGGSVQLFPNIAVNNGSRTMELRIDGASYGNITSSSTTTPRPAGAEVSPIAADLPAGYHMVEFVDSASSAEFDIHYLRVVGMANHCHNLTLDVGFGETDVDCGGPDCGACGSSQMCQVATDCLNNDCDPTTQRCASGATCSDRIQDQDESDVDCGGASCGRCDTGESCNSNSDCLSNDCENRVCLGGSAGSPCASFCPSPETINWNSGTTYQSGALGTGAICRETTDFVAGGNCGNFSGARQLFVNGVQMPCDNQPWPSLPATANGGYCVQTTAGNESYAYFTLWQ
jgi:alpha-tubulin suppressor-like RCC1 family protein